MPSLFAYRKVTDAITTHSLRLPEKQGEQTGQELCTLADGRTVVTIFDGHTLPTQQPSAIAASVEALPSPLPDALRAEIRAASPHARLIAQRLVDRIRSKYTTDDETYFARIGVGQALGTYTMTPGEVQVIAQYQATAEAARAWAKAERDKLGI
jgi:hypothetical protein